MQYKITTIPPSGRHKYGNYLSAGNISKMIVTYDNNGNGTSGVGDKEDNNKDEQPIQKNYALVLSKATNNFEWDDVVANNGVTDIVKPIGYGDLEIVPVFVGDISIVPKDTNDVASKRNYDIKGIEKGVTIAVKGNGTSAATIEIKVDESFEGTHGTLYIPCSVYSGPENQAPYLPSYDANGNLIDDIDTASDYSDWHMARENCKTLWLEYNFNITIPVTNHYTMEITNEIAAVNCDASGNIISNTDIIHCQATMYLGSKEVEGAVYSLTLPTDKEVKGLTINTESGELTFGSNFSFKGSQLEIKIKATKDKTTIYKIMTIVKQYPGADGSPAVIRWVVPSVNVIKLNPNTNTNKLTPNKISCKVMKQVGEEAPVEDTTTTIFYGYDTTNPLNQYSSEITIDASKSYIAFALKNSNNEIYEIETIQIIKDGINGSSGSSVYRLTLTNENTSINADSDGNIYPNANRPTCTATLYYGTTEVSDATYSITTNPTSTGVTINSTTGVITLDSTFNFTGTSLEITVNAMVDGVIYGTSIMTVSKSMAGNNGEDSVSYWLDLSTTAVVVAKGATAATPSSVTLKAYKQIGGNSPTEITSTGVIKWGYSTPVPQRTETTISNIDTASTYIMVHLIVDNVIYDRQTIAIIKDGADGEVGPQGRQGAAIRGPVDWKNQVTSRRWCNGVLENPKYPEDAEFIDIVVYNGTYYKCKTSYEGAGSETTAPPSEYWVATDKQYEFVSTNLLLAENAKINFQTSNELYLMDDNGNVTAGAAGGNGISFWAGANEPANSNFRVNYDGSITAKTGTFAGYIQMPYIRTSTLERGNSSSYGVYVLPKNNAYLIVDSGFYGLGDGCFIKIPEPTAGLNGFTYHIIAQSNIATKGTAEGYYSASKDGYNHSITIETVNKSQKLMQNVFYRDGVSKYHTLAFYSGTVVITCIPSFNDSNEYVWCVTQCEDIDCYINDTLSAVMSKVYSDNSVEKIVCVNGQPTDDVSNSHIIYMIK